MLHTIAHYISVSVIPIGFLVVICFVISGILPKDSPGSQLFAEIAGGILRVLLILLPFWFIAFFIQLK